VIATTLRVFALMRMRMRALLRVVLEALTVDVVDVAVAVVVVVDAMRLVEAVEAALLVGILLQLLVALAVAVAVGEAVVVVVVVVVLALSTTDLATITGTGSTICTTRGRTAMSSGSSGPSTRPDSLALKERAVCRALPVGVGLVDFAPRRPSTRWSLETPCLWTASRRVTPRSSSQLACNVFWPVPTAFWMASVTVVSMAFTLSAH
jgi:hypothetical protein